MFGDLGIPWATNSEIDLVDSNESVLERVIQHRGCGVVAMETEAEGRYDGPVGSFVHLLDHYDNSAACPSTVIGALRMQINFTLMARPGVKIESVKEVLGHPKSFGACRRNIQQKGWRTISLNSNGKAAEEVARNPDFARAVAIGPSVAAEKYGLRILINGFQDEVAITTFYFLGPKNRKISWNVGDVRKDNMSLLVCRLKNKPGMLAKVLSPFGFYGLNIRNIRDFYLGKGEYAHVIHFECPRNKIREHALAMEKATKSLAMERNFLMGPFPVI